MRIEIEQAISLLRSGNVVGVPTETVYGLAACLDQPKAIEKIFELKNRPKINPLIIHLSTIDQIFKYTHTIPVGFEELAKNFWPGPLTCILPVNDTVPSIARAGLPTAGFRIPDHSLTRQIIESTGPLVMPSANVSGRPSATRPDHIEQDFGMNFPILDGGECKKGVESTILLYNENRWNIVRFGAISSEQFTPILGYQPHFLEKGKNAKPLSPGQLFKHYAPKATLHLTENLDEEFPCMLGFIERNYKHAKRVFVLGSLSDPEDVAKNLYHFLRKLDEEKIDAAWIDMNFPKEGLWETIAERLTRAAQQ